MMLLAMVGCGSSPASTSTSLDDASSGMDLPAEQPGDDVPADRPVDTSTGASCTGSIDEVLTAAFHLGSGPACPTTYTEAMRTPPSCGAGPKPPTFGKCGDQLVFSANCFLHGFVCVYDATSLTLVGAAAFDDTPSYCQKRSTCIQGGTLPAGIACDSDRLLNSCVLENEDGGTSDADALDLDAPIACDPKACGPDQICVHEKGGTDASPLQANCYDIPADCAGTPSCACLLHLSFPCGMYCQQTAPRQFMCSGG
jgi:hypothetical protein